MRKAKAFVFAAEEDFGIIPVEAQACGTPVIALKKGGTLETVVENETGIFFEEQSVEKIKEAISSKYIFCIKRRYQFFNFSREEPFKSIFR